MKIYVKSESRIEEELAVLGLSKSQARVLGAVVRGMVGDVIRKEQHDTIRFNIGGTLYNITINKEQ